MNNDFITPGTPFQMYSIGVGGSYGTASYVGGNTLGASTIQTGPLATLTTGGYGGLTYSQSLSFTPGSSIINFAMTLHNPTAAAITDIAFASGFDPDPDVYQHFSYFTQNQIVAPGIVQATGPDTGNSIIIQDLSGGAVADIQASWPDYNPYDLLTGYNDGNGDWSIFDAWSIPTLAAGASETIDYNYIINATPVTSTSPILTTSTTTPDGASTLALLGLALTGLGVARRKMKA